MSEENAAAKSLISIHYIICECGETFPTENALKSHLEKEHPRKKERKEYRCGVCSAIYEAENDCIKHYEDTHIQENTAEVHEDELCNNKPTTQEIVQGTELTIPEENYELLGTEYVNGQEIEEQMEEEFIIEEEALGGYVVQQFEVGEFEEEYNEEQIEGINECLEGEYVTRDDLVKDEFNGGVLVKQELEEGEIPLEEGEIPVYHIEMPKPKKKRGRRIVPKSGPDPQLLFIVPEGENQGEIVSMLNKSGRQPRGEKTITCEVCGRHYASNAALRYHQRTHTGERPYKCHLCPKAFAMPLFLQIHVRCHTGERPYQCPHCEKAFSNKAALLRHDRVHTGVKPYKCPMCAKTFTQSNSMKLHVTTVHLKQPTPYKSKNRKLKAMENQNSGKKIKPNPRKKLAAIVDTVDVLRNGLESYVLGPLKTDLERFKNDIDRLARGEFDSDMEGLNAVQSIETRPKFESDLENLQAVESIEGECKEFEVVEEVLYDDDKDYCEVICAEDDVSSG